MTSQTTPSTPARAWFSRAGAVALVLLVAQFFWRGYYLWGGYYFQDDFNMLRLGEENALTWDYLMQPYAGHVWPGNFLIAWIAARVDPASWTLTATTVLLMQAACGAMMWVVLSRITQDWRIRVPMLVGYLVCPLTLWATQWWASAIGFVPLCFFMLVAVWGLLRRIQDDWRWGSVVAVLAFQLGLFFQERAILYTVVLGGIAVVLGSGRLDRRILTALRRHWMLWLALVVVLSAWLGFHNLQTPIEVTAPGGEHDAGTAIDYFFRSLLPGLAGGPWLTEYGGGPVALLVPTTAAAITGSLVTGGALLLVLLRTGGSGRLALLLVGVYAVLDLALIYGGRNQFEGTFGLVPRYMADVAPIACMGVALALADLRSPLVSRRALARHSTAAVVVATVTYVVSAGLTTSHIAPMQQGREAKEYVATLEAEMSRHPDSVLYNRPAPNNVMVDWFGDEGRISTVLGISPQRPVFDVMSEELLVPDDGGYLKAPNLAFLESVPPVEDDACGHRISESEGPVRLTLPDGPFRAWYVVKVSYFTGGESVVRVQAEEQTEYFLAREGAHTTYMVLENDSDHLEIGWESGDSLVCVTGVETGFPSSALQ